MCLRKSFAVLTVLVFIFSYGFSKENAWQKIPTGFLESSVNYVLVNEEAGKISYYAATQGAIYRSLNDLNHFKPIFHLSGLDSKIYQLYIDSQSLTLYAATSHGLYATKLDSLKWQQLHFSSHSSQKECFSVVVIGNLIYLGTQDGLLYKDEESRVWQEASSLLTNEPVYFLESDGKYIYISANTKIYRFEWYSRATEQIFSLFNREEANKEENFETQEGDAISTDVQQKVKAIKINEKYFWAATVEGIFYTDRQDINWQKLSFEGLPLEDITSLAVVSNPQISSSQNLAINFNIFAGTGKGIFYLNDDNRWESLYKGLETNTVNFLTTDANNGLFVATDKGIFSMPLAHESTFQNDQNSNTIADAIDYHLIEQQFQNEPTIQQLQEMAIEYADVDPKKINTWKKQARYKAFLPSLSAGLDRADTDLYHWDTGQNPDKILRGKDFLTWDVSLSWDFADLIFSSDQTSIDSRSKLMVELREEVLNEVTRLYFERRRLQIELLTTQAMESSLKFDKQMRIAELTALLDSFTGGEFSRKLTQ